MSTKMQQRIEWRRAKVMKLLTKGESNQSEIALILQVDKSFVCMDIAYLRQQAKTNIKRYIDERLPEEYEKCLVRLNAIFTDSVYMYCLMRDIISSWRNNKEVSCMLPCNSYYLNYLITCCYCLLHFMMKIIKST
jgi:hypothetical protein